MFLLSRMGQNYPNEMPWKISNKILNFKNLLIIVYSKYSNEKLLNYSGSNQSSQKVCVSVDCRLADFIQNLLIGTCKIPIAAISNIIFKSVACHYETSRGISMLDVSISGAHVVRNNIVFRVLVRVRRIRVLCITIISCIKCWKCLCKVLESAIWVSSSNLFVPFCRILSAFRNDFQEWCL